MPYRSFYDEVEFFIEDFFGNKVKVAGLPDLTMTEDPKWEIPDIERVYISGHYTTIEWADGKKTTVGCSPDDNYSEYAGFAACVLKRLFGSSSNASNVLKAHRVVTTSSKKEKKANA